MLKKMTVQTNNRTEFLDITSQIQKVVNESGVEEGVCYTWVPHTTAGITVNEHADPTVVRDMLKELNKIVPFDDNYAHAEGNSAAHIKTSLIGTSLHAIIAGSRIQLGTWQGIFLGEFDGPRSRQVWVKIIAG